MRVQEIQHQQWPRFFDDFSHLHCGKHVNVETISQAGLSSASRFSDQPLVGIISAPDVPGLGERIEVIVGGQPTCQAAHCVTNPRHVWLGEEDGWMVAVQIESEDGSMTVVRFEPPREGMPGGFKIA